MTIKRLVPTLLLATVLGACTSLLDVEPVDEISENIAIVDQASAQAALVGAYAALESGDYYGGDYLMWTETLTPNVEHTGTFEGFADADALVLRADMSNVPGMWYAIYEGISAVNLLLQRVPDIEGLDPDFEDELLGQAHALRALHYFNLVRAWGDVPLVLTPPATLEEAAQVSRAPAASVYTQILADLDAAETMLSGLDNSVRTFVSPGFIWAMKARVALYQEDWATAEAEARRLVTSGDYDLTTTYAELFTDAGDPTTEDIFRVSFTETVFNNLGYYYQYAGRFEIGATDEIYNLYEAGDDRWDVNFDGTRSDGIQVVKFPTTIGGEDLSVIRYADVLLILAEALAQQGGAADLNEAVGFLNDIRTRASVPTYNLGADLITQQDVLDAIHLERRLELAFEGEYWFDLVRTDRAAAALGSRWQPYKALWPIPVAELDVAPNLTQNPGY